MDAATKTALTQLVVGLWKSASGQDNLEGFDPRDTRHIATLSQASYEQKAAALRAVQEAPIYLKGEMTQKVARFAKVAAQLDVALDDLATKAANVSPMELAHVRLPKNTSWQAPGPGQSALYEAHILDSMSSDESSLRREVYMDVQKDKDWRKTYNDNHVKDSLAGAGGAFAGALIPPAALLAGMVHAVRRGRMDPEGMVPLLPLTHPVAVLGGLGGAILGRHVAGHNEKMRQGWQRAAYRATLNDAGHDPDQYVMSAKQAPAFAASSNPVEHYFGKALAAGHKMSLGQFKRVWENPVVAATRAQKDDWEKDNASRKLRGAVLGASAGTYGSLAALTYASRHGGMPRLSHLAMGAAAPFLGAAVGSVAGGMSSPEPKPSINEAIRRVL